MMTDDVNVKAIRFALAATFYAARVIASSPHLAKEERETLMDESIVDADYLMRQVPPV